MQTTETHHALVLDPDGLAVPHLDGLHGALLRAQPAADAVIPDAEIRGAPCAVVVHRLGYQLGDERRSARKHVPVRAALAHAAYRAADIRFRRAGKSRGLLGRREVENRRPGVRHAHRVVRVDFPPANGPDRHDSGSAGESPVGGDEEQVAGFERSLAEKFPDDARQPPEVGGGHNADDLVLKGIAAVADAVDDGQRLLPLGLREPRSDIFAVSRRGKI